MALHLAQALDRHRQRSHISDDRPETILSHHHRALVAHKINSNAGIANDALLCVRGAVLPEWLVRRHHNVGAANTFDLFLDATVDAVPLISRTLETGIAVVIALVSRPAIGPCEWVGLNAHAAPPSGFDISASCSET